MVGQTARPDFVTYSRQLLRTLLIQSTDPAATTDLVVSLGKMFCNEAATLQSVPGV